MVAMLDHVHKLKKIEEDGVEVVGTVTSKQCENHGKLFYKFSARNENVEGASTLCGPRCGDVKVGDEISVRYYSGDPTLNECGTVREKTDDLTLKIYGAALVILGTLFFNIIAFGFMKGIFRFGIK